MHVAAAQQAVAEGQLETAVGRLRAASGLWRGPALGGAPGLAAQAARLEEQRLAVIEERVELELALGRHSDLVPDLSGLVAAHPLREQLVRQLMVALYRCGRWADALEVYRLAEKRLASELGLDPGDRLRKLELAILRADPALDCPQPAAVSVAPAPAQLLPDIARFTGRDGDLSALTSLLAERGDAGDRAMPMAEPDNNCRIRLTVAALSSTTSTRRPANRDQYMPAASATSNGIRSALTPSARRNRARASTGRIGGPGAYPRRSMNSCPSGKRCAI